jgi:DNA-binding transcriptional MerR regulator
MAGRPYDKNDLRLIATMRNNGISIPAIAKSLGRTPAGIQGAMRARGWVDPARSKAMGSAKVFTAEQKRAFQDLICSNVSGHTSSDIRDEWNKEAAARGWPAVNNDRVIRYRRESGLQPPKSEYMQYESYRRKQSVAQKARRAKERQARRQALRARRAELYGREPDLLRRKCQACHEIWPLTREFFHQAGGIGKYFLNSCRICYHNASGTAEERRARRMELYDRQATIIQISRAKAERDALLRQKRNFPTQRCSRCHETWELLPQRYPKYKGRGGKELYRKTCRFCLRAIARLKERANLALNRASTRDVLSQAGHQLHERPTSVTADTAWSQRLI